jgi:succinyl-CoA:acetate CoA-transferase
MSAEQAARFIENDMTVGMSGFTRAGEAKAVPQALVEQAKKSVKNHVNYWCKSRK